MAICNKEQISIVGLVETKVKSTKKTQIINKMFGGGSFILTFIHTTMGGSCCYGDLICIKWIWWLAQLRC